MKNLPFSIFIAFNFFAFAQKENIFHDRDFWKTNPTIEIIDQKISEGNDISALNKNAFDAVVYAILENVENKTIKYILSKPGNDVNKKTHDGRTYIFWAAYRDNVEMMKFVFSKGAKTDIVDTHGNTFLNFAASTGQLDQELYDYSFEIGADIKTEKNHEGANALLLVAPYIKNYKTVKYFVSKGASLEDKDNIGNGIFEYVAKGGNTALLKTLLKNGVKKGKNAMIFASQGLRRKKNTLETYQFLESLGVQPNIVDKKDRNPLHAIAYNSKDLSIYNYFIKKGVAVNLQDKGGDSPFMNAANNNTLEVVKFLSKYVKNINLENENGRSALAMAVSRNTIDVVKFLIEKGADINTKDKDGNTLSYYAINNFKPNNTERFEAKLKLLQENGLVINELQNSENTLLHIATQKNNLALLKRLSTFNIDVNAINKENLSALQIAAMTAKDDKIMKYLLNIGADKSVKTDFDETVYDLASENELLQKQSINISYLK
ncbi:ankyrin repeat domain-containing protein [uncultured Polaribacter sp.]|uniref:ankyrin repeat domain-containing protein n=1 Tax=uncultured Polaribacter sp. TaxID=174711 RepID=UPI00260EAAA8|nr:ankyrin repeat domain-containing protein [uncultured Polaribacter sp.]